MAAAQPIDQIRGHEPAEATSLAGAKPISKFVDPTIYGTFSFSSTCPKSMAAASAHLRLALKNVAKQSAVDPASAIFAESELILSWRRPVVTKAAHAWFYRALAGVNWKGGDGTWSVQPKTGQNVARGSVSVVTNPAPITPITVATSPAVVFPTSPALKLLRGGDKSLETESRYELGQEMGSGTFGTVFAAKVGNRSVAIKRFKAETIGQARIDAAEVAVSGMGCCRLNASRSSADGRMLRHAIRRNCLFVVCVVVGCVWVWSGCVWVCSWVLRAGTW